MKKILTLAMAFVAIASYSASIQWTMNCGPMFVKNADNAKMAGSAYLILASDSSKIDAYLTEDLTGFNAAMTALSYGSTSISNGKIGGGNNFTGTALLPGFTNDKSYDFAVVLLDTATSMYVVTDLSPGVTFDESLEVPSPSKVSFSTNAFGASSSANPNPKADSFKSAVIVPEPATGALALAGIALLFRRKRA